MNPRKASGDPVWDLTCRIIEKRIRPGHSAKSILNDFALLYRGLRRLAPKSVSKTPLDLTREFLSTKSERLATRRQTPRIQ
jgi:hypothetical protein